MPRPGKEETKESPPSIKSQLEAGAKESAKENAARSPKKEKPAKGAER